MRIRRGLGQTDRLIRWSCQSLSKSSLFWYQLHQEMRAFIKARIFFPWFWNLGPSPAHFQITHAILLNMLGEARLYAYTRPAQAPSYIGPKSQSLVHLTAQIQLRVVKVQVGYGLASLFRWFTPIQYAQRQECFHGMSKTVCP